MKLLFENWRKQMQEGEVIEFPRQPSISEDNLQFVISTEGQIAHRLEDIYGNTSEVPIEKIEVLDKVVDMIEELLKA